ncbi:hypothetical protein GX51_06055 [Blastomyces parvus]|uniref:Uncharacterized protein n=1 Tax=Blastomyces parvus TaxID=2060905 RepID=A0A2B7WTN3_9EURO|nr:hypothetical protein GX51_06055 [Blastomyces parvus]
MNGDSRAELVRYDFGAAIVVGPHPKETQPYRNCMMDCKPQYIYSQTNSSPS